MKEISVFEIEKNAFQLIGKDWTLITAKKGELVNTMTASWGGLGVLWNKNVAFIVIRPQRYTKEFVDSSDTLSLTFFDEKYRKDLTYLGRVSGKDEPKIQKVGFTILEDQGTPYFQEACLTLICKKLYSQLIVKEAFFDQSLNDQVYPKSDHHTLYVLEITKVLIQD